jgi:hypothetical protein
MRSTQDRQPIGHSSEPDDRHCVFFYREGQSLAETVAGFLEDGFLQEQPAIVIASPSHRTAIARHLVRAGFDPERLRHQGELVMLDARDTLLGFMLGGHIDDGCFRNTVGHLLEQVRRGRERTTLRAYGEIVDVLWKDGKPEAALHLEVLWNELARTVPMALLCGYAMRNFCDEVDGAGFHDVCALHTNVVSPAVADA